MNEPRILVWLLLEQDGAFLLGRRKPDLPPFAGQWTLPGDTMPDDESASETMARFGRDQLDVRVTHEDFFDTLELSHLGIAYAINVFRVAYTGQPRFRESGPYTEVRWLLPGDLTDASAYPMPSPLRTALLAAERSRT
jgi:ADP-ribose pyrophosphatase YjhB (NUDIX family)